MDWTGLAQILSGIQNLAIIKMTWGWPGVLLVFLSTIAFVALILGYLIIRS
jgi:hypothetical protein